MFPLGEPLFLLNYLIRISLDHDVIRGTEFQVGVTSPQIVSTTQTAIPFKVLESAR